jgi:hypothetical protein
LNTLITSLSEVPVGIISTKQFICGLVNFWISSKIWNFPILRLSDSSISITAALFSRAGIVGVETRSLYESQFFWLFFF